MSEHFSWILGIKKTLVVSVSVVYLRHWLGLLMSVVIGLLKTFTPSLCYQSTFSDSSQPTHLKKSKKKRPSITDDSTLVSKAENASPSPKLCTNGLLFGVYWKENDSNVGVSSPSVLSPLPSASRADLTRGAARHVVQL